MFCTERSFVAMSKMRLGSAELTKMGFGLEGKIFGGSPYKAKGKHFVTASNVLSNVN